MISKVEISKDVLWFMAVATMGDCNLQSMSKMRCEPLDLLDVLRTDYFVSGDGQTNLTKIGFRAISKVTKI